MDSKSVHRVARDLSIDAMFDAASRKWIVGDFSFTPAEIESMSSLDMRAKLVSAKGGTMVISARQMIAESKDAGEGHGEDRPNAAEPRHPDFLRARQDRNAAAELTSVADAERAAPKKKKAAAGQKKPAAKAKGMEDRRLAVKIDGSPVIKPKREKEGGLSLRQFGIHKWQLRRKAKVHEASAEVKKMLAKPTQWFTNAELRSIIKEAVFVTYDKDVLAHPDEHSDYAVAASKTARDIAERMLKAL